MPCPIIELIPITSLRPYGRNARTHSKKQIRQIASSIERFGFTNPVLISDNNQIIAGQAGLRPPSSLRTSVFRLFACRI
jgi:ParB-like chromosome segregation protein Spo0J